MSISLGGQTFTEDQVIAAIAASNDPTPGHCPTMTLEELDGVVQALLLRVATLEAQHLNPRVGFNVTKTEDSTNTFYRVQTVDPVGRSIWVTFEVPKDAGGSAAY